MTQLVRAESQHVVEAGIGAIELERGIQLTLATEHAGRQLVRQAPIAFGEPGEVAIARISQRCTGAHGAENLEGRATRGGS